jgi:hypothetical protein
MKNGNKFAPKVVGQAGIDTFNHYFGHLNDKEINRDSFKDFCINKINEIMPIFIDYALVSDNNCFVYYEKDKLICKIVPRGNLPDLTFEYGEFSFSKKSSVEWKESNSVAYKGMNIMEIQLHKNRKGFKFRLNRDTFILLTEIEKMINNSTLGDTAELALCNVFKIDPGIDNNRLINNANKELLLAFESHYETNKTHLFPQKPIKYYGTKKRDRKGQSKSGIDFICEGDTTLSLKTNKSSSFKVCPPEVGQPSPKTFDMYFANKSLYDGNIDENKFRILVTDPNKVVFLLNEYLKFINECDYLVWSKYLRCTISSRLIRKTDLEKIKFDPRLITYSNDFTEKSSVGIKYGTKELSLGEFQIHSARNSLKFRFNMQNLLML